MKKNALLSALLLIFAALAPSHADILERSKAPRAVEVLSGEDIDNSSVRSIDEIINLAPGITTAAPSSGVSIPGAGPGAQNEPLVLVNGVAVSGPGLHGSESVPVPSDLIDRVEIIKGAAAVSVYGPDAAVGVINIVTKGKFRGLSQGGSFLLNDVQRGLSRNWFSVESKHDCDATNGSTVPAWTFWKNHDFGQPSISDGGDIFSWGSVKNGYTPPSLWFPQTGASVWSGNFKFDETYSYKELERAMKRIQEDTETSAQDRQDFLVRLAFAYVFMDDPEFLSDESYATGIFNPDDLFQVFREWAGKRTDADRTNFKEKYGIPGDLSEFPPATKPSTPQPQPEASGSSEPDPFDQYPYPPDYAFDLSRCTTKQKKDLLQLIKDRDKARADRSYYMDYMRRPGQTAEDVRADEANARQAIETRNANNEKLRQKWRECIGASPATASRTAQAAEPATAPKPAEDTNPDSGNRGTDNWSLELHVDYQRLEDSPAPEPGYEADIGFSVFRFDYSRLFGLPFTAGANRDVDLDAGITGKRAFTDDAGIARIPNAFSADFGSGKPTLGLQAGYDYGAGALATPRTPGAMPGAGADRGLGNTDWDLFLDYDFKNMRSGPTIGLKYQYTPADSVFQQFSGLGKPGMTFSGLPPATQDSVPDYFKSSVSDGFSIGSNFYSTYTYSELGKYDLSLLDKVKGQTFWGNNYCGDSALPPEGAGYLTAEQSPVKSVADQWALARVGLQGDEPTLDEFAKPVVVGIIDTGLDWDHLDFAWDNLWRNEDEIPDNGIDDDGNGYIDDVIGWNFTDENNRPWDNDGHGTFVAGIIAATQGNGAGIDGINGNARIMVLKAVNNFGRTRASYVARAIVYGADNGARILNLSVTGPGFPLIVQDAVDYAQTKGVLVVVAAGNRAEDIGEARPALLRGAMMVAATGTDDQRTAFSNVGDAIDIAAPGIDVVSLRARGTDFMFNSATTPYVPGDAVLGDDRRYYRSTGTSFAAPIVSGVASLLLSNNPGLTPGQLRRILEQSARDVETPGRDRFTGYGIVDAKAALAADPAYFVDAAITALELVEADGLSYLRVAGDADANAFAGATLEIGAGENPAAWTSAGAPLAIPVTAGELGRIDAAQLKGSPTWTIRLVVSHANGSKREARYVVDLK